MCGIGVWGGCTVILLAVSVVADSGFVRESLDDASRLTRAVAALLGYAHRLVQQARHVASQYRGIDFSYHVASREERRGGAPIVNGCVTMDDFRAAPSFVCIL